MNNLTHNERQRIEFLLKKKKSHRQIATELGRDRRTIDREINRNSITLGYVGEIANLCHKQRKNSPRPNVKSNTLEAINFVTKYISSFSPDVISGRAKLEKKTFSISHETVYKIIYNNSNILSKYLLTKRKKRRVKKQSKGKSGAGTLIDQRMISERSPAVENRSRFGHLEIDTIVGKNHRGSIVTAVDKKSCFAFGGLCKDRKAKTITSVLSGRLKKSVRPIKTITADNGKEFAYHKKLERNTGAKVYFANPGCPQERGQNENFNRILRRDFPKGTSFSKLNSRSVQATFRKINNTPRKLLKYLTPAEVYFDIKPGAILN